MKSLLLATMNLHKVEEIQAILSEFPIQWRSLRDFPHLEAPDETGSTYLENALLKARFYSKQTGLPALADDSGLEIDALEGAPGVHSARFAGAHTPHSEKIQRVLELLAENGNGDRTARFRCVAALVTPDGQELAEEGVCAGLIADSPRGEGGFGYDPIFWLPDRDCTMAELSEVEKNRISHRARAFLGLMREWFPASP